MTCCNTEVPARSRFAVAPTEYPVVEDVDAFTPRFVLEPTWKLLLVPIELLNWAVPEPLKLMAPGEAAVTVNIGVALPTAGASKPDARAAASKKMDFFTGCNRMVTLVSLANVLYIKSTNPSTSTLSINAYIRTESKGWRLAASRR